MYSYDRVAASPRWDKSKTKRWMEQNVDDHVDHSTDEVNSTGLAEAAANEFDIYEDTRDYKIPDEVFDLAVDVGAAWERKHKKASYSYDRRAASEDGIPKGAELTVVLRRGQWPTDMFTRGSTLEVTKGAGIGEIIELKHKGQVMGGPYDFKIVEKKGENYTLDSNNDRFKRSIKVKLKDS